jgi:hypothetical protein
LAHRIHREVDPRIVGGAALALGVDDLEVDQRDVVAVRAHAARRGMQRELDRRRRPSCLQLIARDHSLLPL